MLFLFVVKQNDILTFSIMHKSDWHWDIERSE